MGRRSQKLARRALAQKLRQVSRGGSAPRTHPIGDRQQGGHPRWPSPRLRPEPGCPRRPGCTSVLRSVRGPPSSPLCTPAPATSRPFSAPSSRSKGARGSTVWGVAGGGSLPAPDRANARSPRLQSRRGATSEPCPAPPPTPPPKPTPLLPSTYLGQAELSVPPGAFLSFLPPSPSSSCWLPPGTPALASGSSGSPSRLSLRAHRCPPAASAAAVRRGVSSSGGRCPKRRACCSSGAGWGWPSARLCFRRVRGAPHASRSRARLRCTQLGRGAGPHGGTGQAQVRLGRGAGPAGAQLAFPSEWIAVLRGNARGNASRTWRCRE